MLIDEVSRRTSDNRNLKYGMRYTRDYMNFMVLNRSCGPNSARQFGLVTSAIGGALFSCHPHASATYQLHTHSPERHVLYNLGCLALTRQAESSNYSLAAITTKHWVTLNKPRVRKILPKIFIPGERNEAVSLIASGYL